MYYLQVIYPLLLNNTTETHDGCSFAIGPACYIITLLERNRQGDTCSENESKEKMQKLQMEKNGCPQCGSLNLGTDGTNGEVVCSQCGLVIVENALNRAPEGRAYTLEEQRSKSRTGAPIRYSNFDKGLHTTIRGFKRCWRPPAFK
jgi:ribosomal protein S27AE